MTVHAMMVRLNLYVIAAVTAFNRVHSFFGSNATLLSARACTAMESFALALHRVNRAKLPPHRKLRSGVFRCQLEYRREIGNHQRVAQKRNAQFFGRFGRKRQVVILRNRRDSLFGQSIDKVRVFVIRDAAIFGCKVKIWLGMPPNL
jgi:hypothetical protein